MATFGVVLRDIVQGESYTLARDVLGVPLGLAVTSATLVVRLRADDPPGAALYVGMVTAAPSPLGSIVRDGSLDGIARFTIMVPGVSERSTATLLPSTTTGVTVTAVAPGSQTDLITLGYSVTGASTPLSIDVTTTPVGSATRVVITVHGATDPGGASLTTASQVVAALTADPVVSAWVTAALAEGSDGTGPIITVPPVGLQGGLLGTEDARVGAVYPYRITLGFSDGSSTDFEGGTLVVRAVTNVTVETAVISGAAASETGSSRYDGILNRYVDATLELLRRLKCWDLQGRRSGNDPTVLVFPFRRWNPSFLPEVYDATDHAVPANRVQVDYTRGTIRVLGDPGYQSYYATFEFDYFGVDALQAWLDVTLQELNLLGGESRYITHYPSVDAAPPGWDGALTIGVIAKAYRRLAIDASLWGVRNIWADASAAQQLATSLADHADQQFQEIAKATKWERYVAQPTIAYRLFESIGFGSYTFAGHRSWGAQLSGSAIL
jgi:hypothetical protein